MVYDSMSLDAKTNIRNRRRQYDGHITPLGYYNILTKASEVFLIFTPQLDNFSGL